MTCKGAYLVFVKLVYPKKITELDRKEMLSLFLKSCVYAWWREEVVTIFGGSGHLGKLPSPIVYQLPWSASFRLSSLER